MLARDQSGAGAEYAICIELGAQWDAALKPQPPDAPDAPPDWQVRCTKPSGGLRHWLNDKEHYRYVLVTHDHGTPLVFTIRGWLYGHECRQGEPDDPFGDGYPRWYVPQTALRDWNDQ
jgi:hypothetical protein